MTGEPSVSSERVRSAYDEWASAYDSDRNPTRDLNAAVLRKQPFDLPGKAVLEIGCGTGLNTEWLAHQASSVIAVDISQGMLERARARISCTNVQFIGTDVSRGWTFDAGAFDVVMANLILEHIDDLRHVFLEAFRVLRRGGLFYIAELHPFKQILGSQARYQRSGDEVRIHAVRHMVSEYVNEGLHAGFHLDHASEWQTEEDKMPRLLTLRFSRPV